MPEEEKEPKGDDNASNTVEEASDSTKVCLYEKKVLQNKVHFLFQKLDSETDI
jgi:hypothetical protein